MRRLPTPLAAALLLATADVEVDEAPDRPVAMGPRDGPPRVGESLSDGSRKERRKRERKKRGPRGRAKGKRPTKETPHSREDSNG